MRILSTFRAGRARFGQATPGSVQAEEPGDCRGCIHRRRFDEAAGSGLAVAALGLAASAPARAQDPAYDGSAYQRDYGQADGPGCDRAGS